MNGSSASSASSTSSTPSTVIPSARSARVRISHPDKLFWPDEGYTKLDLANFYDTVFAKLAPYVRDRLLALERCPEGLHGQCFFQKEKPAGLPEDTPTRRILHQKGLTNYVVGGRRETQIALANLGCIAVHVWSSRARTPRKPDWVCFDLDPASGLFADAIGAALLLKEALEALKLTSFPKTSGGKGLHVLVPIRTGPDADEVLRFSQRLGARLASAFPKQLTVEARIRDRGSRVYLDPFRNGFAQTVVAPYSVRCRPGAPVSTPLAWSEVKPGLDPDLFTMGNFEKRLGRKDPWEEFFRSRQSFAAAESAIGRL
jgi:bifunctional non-homologous end joining protein LigD